MFYSVDPAEFYTLKSKKDPSGHHASQGAPKDNLSYLTKTFEKLSYEHFEVFNLKVSTWKYQILNLFKEP